MNHSTSIPSLCLTLLAALWTTAAAPCQDSGEEAQALEELFRAYHEAGLFSGTALVANQGEIVYAGGFGMANHSWSIPNAVDTRYEVASLTKHFTATAILQLVEAGKVDLDGKLGDYLKGLREDVGAVTIRQTLSHQAGLRRDLFEEVEDVAIAHDGPERLEALNRTPLIHPAGTRMAYSNAGYCALAMVVTQVSGQDYASYLKDHIFEPAGMDSTSFPDAVWPLPHLATGYELCLGEPILAAVDHPSNNLGAGGLATTVEDLHRFDRAMARGDLLSPEMQATMASPAVKNWGLGCQLMPIRGEDGEFTYVVYHNGDDGGFASHFLRYPPDGFALILLSNHWTLPRTDLLGGVSAILNGEVPEAPKPRIDMDLFRAIVTEGVDAGLKMQRELFGAGRRDLPTSIHVHMQANMLARANRLEEAKALHRFNTKAHPQAWYGLVGLGTVFETEDDFEAAADCYLEALELFPDNPAALELLKAIEQRE